MTEKDTGERQNTPVIPPSPHKMTATPECRKKTPAAKPASLVKTPPSSLPATSKAPEKPASPPRQQTESSTHQSGSKTMSNEHYSRKDNPL